MSFCAILKPSVVFFCTDFLFNLMAAAGKESTLVPSLAVCPAAHPDGEGERGDGPAQGAGEGHHPRLPEPEDQQGQGEPAGRDGDAAGQDQQAVGAVGQVKGGLKQFLKPSHERTFYGCTLPPTNPTTHVTEWQKSLDKN